jgi:hypothetical protein
MPGLLDWLSFFPTILAEDETAPQALPGQWTSPRRNADAPLCATVRPAEVQQVAKRQGRTSQGAG